MKRSSWNDWRISITSSLLLGLTSLPGVEEVSEREAFPLVTPWQSFSSITKTCFSRPDSLIRTQCVWVFCVRVVWVYSVRLRWLKWDSNTVFSNKSTLYAENTGDWLLKQLTPFEACSWVTVYLKCSLLRIVFIVAPYLNRLILRPVTTGKFLSANNSSLKNKCIIVAISSTQIWWSFPVLSWHPTLDRGGHSKQHVTFWQKILDLRMQKTEVIR